MARQVVRGRNRVRLAAYARLLRDAGRPVSAGEVHQIVQENRGAVVQMASVHKALSLLVRRGLVLRPYKGLYLHPAVLPRGIRSVRFKYPPLARPGTIYSVGGQA